MLPQFTLQADTRHFHQAITNKTVGIYQGITYSVGAHLHFKFHKEPEVRRSNERKSVGCCARQYHGGEIFRQKLAVCLRFSLGDAIQLCVRRILKLEQYLLEH